MAQNPRYSYNDIPDMQTVWSKDPTNGKQFSGTSVQKFIKEQLKALCDADTDAKKKNPSAFGGFVDNVTLKNTDAGSDYVKIVYDVTRHMFFAVTLDDEVEKYHRQYDAFNIYNNGEFPNAHPYADKLYLYGNTTYVWNGEDMASTTPVASEESVRSIVKNWTQDIEP